MIVILTIQQDGLEDDFIGSKRIFHRLVVCLKPFHDFRHRHSVERKPSRSLIVIWKWPFALQVQNLLSLDKILLQLSMKHIVPIIEQIKKMIILSAIKSK